MNAQDTRDQSHDHKGSSDIWHENKSYIVNPKGELLLMQQNHKHVAINPVIKARRAKCRSEGSIRRIYGQPFSVGLDSGAEASNFRANLLV